MSAAAPSPPPAATPPVGGPDAPSDAPAGDSCPLCGAPLGPDQDWCLNCGAAARTRLAASSRWKAPLIAAAVVATLALAVLAAAVVKLVSDANSHARNTVVVIQTPAPAAPTTPAPTAPAPATPHTAVALGAVTLLSSSAATLNGSVNPQGVPTTYQFHFRTTASSAWTPSAAPVAVGAGTGPVYVNARVAGLTPRTTYHYTLTGIKAGRPVTTPAATFTTPGTTGASGQPAAPATPPAARARLTVPAKRRLAEIEARLRASKFPSEQQQLRLEEQRVLAGR